MILNDQQTKTLSDLNIKIANPKTVGNFYTFRKKIIIALGEFKSGWGAFILSRRFVMTAGYNESPRMNLLQKL